MEVRSIRGEQEPTVDAQPPTASRKPETGDRKPGTEERGPASVTENRGPSSRQQHRRFFFSGDGRLALQHAHFDTTIEVQYRLPSGEYDPQGLARIRHFFRSREDGREGDVSLRLIELLDYIEDRYQPRSMTLISGYRSPAFNENLRAGGGAAARASLHTQGLAADVALEGLQLEPVWQDLRELGAGGIGYYRSNSFLHIDTGPPRFWEESTSRVSENLSADNARIFLRTDFDRYTNLDDAQLELHSVTVLPLRIAPEAGFGGAATHTLLLEPLDGATIDPDGCIVFATPADAYRLRVRTVGETAPTEPQPPRSAITLRTCSPRVGKTPHQVVSNPIEVGAENGAER